MTAGYIFTSPSISLGGCSDLEILATVLSICGHHGGGAVDGNGFRPRSPLEQRGIGAADVPGSSSAGDSRQPELPYPCFRWSKGDPPQPHFAGCYFTSRHKADAEAFKPLCPGASRRPRPKWFVPGGGDAGQVPELRTQVRWQRTRWLFLRNFKGPCCKSTGPGCIFGLFLDLVVICAPPTNECSI